MPPNNDTPEQTAIAVGASHGLGRGIADATDPTVSAINSWLDGVLDAPEPATQRAGTWSS